MGLLTVDMKRVVEEQRLGFVAMVHVHSAQPIDSPAYDLGLTEDEVRARWERHFQSLRAGTTISPTGE